MSLFGEITGGQSSGFKNDRGPEQQDRQGDRTLNG